MSRYAVETALVCWRLMRQIVRYSKSTTDRRRDGAGLLEIDAASNLGATQQALTSCRDGAGLLEIDAAGLIVLAHEGPKGRDGAGLLEIDAVIKAHQQDDLQTSIRSWSDSLLCACSPAISEAPNLSKNLYSSRKRS